MDGMPGSLSDLPPEIVAFDIGPRMVRAMIAVTAIAILVVAIRMVVRWRAMGGLRLGVDDWLMFAAALLLIGFTVTGCLTVYRGGVGRYLVVNMLIDPQLWANASLFLYISQFFYLTLLLTLKATILTMYLRIFPTPFMRASVYVIGAFIAVWYITAIFITTFQCIPIEKSYMPYMKEGHCLDNTKWFLGSSVPNIIQDIMILFLPTHEVWKLHLPRAQKFAISGVFLLGVATIVVACIRVRELVRNIETHEDISKSLVLGFILTTVEPAVAMICGSLPTLTPLLRIIFGRAFASRHSRNKAAQHPVKDIETIGGSNRKSKGFASSGSVSRPDRPLVGGRDSLDSLDTVSNGDEKNWSPDSRTTWLAATEQGLGNQIAISSRPTASPPEIPLTRIVIERDFTWSAETVPPKNGSDSG